MRVSWYRQELELEASEFQDIEELNESLYIALSEICKEEEQLLVLNGHMCCFMAV
jgi:hypothetical protein